ncbi:hypothetical protein A2116_00990 [Candidatus Jorgensenbacteria bacterium GWA1_49_17]|uniref:VanZ-like domain-containing protein n=2 Tax=Candidatus Joergenseniibacteriota TaxID=1752739 RepID=A0A1F6BM67_9BACT|nr:MAG: hypothetical protein A2127_01800 [Candidatus Jorgensenbacteria bacterium GWC1_48_12]OGG40303.1 MAG: hypothetical protein A2116_00990 [Candidatus Jorgensenbacteria bacterium GWA1_49_17]
MENKHFHRRKGLEKELIIVGLVLVLGHILGSYYHWYDRYFFSDIIVHFAGGAWVALAALAAFPSLGTGSGFKKSLLSLALIVLLAGAGWEIFEFTVEHYYLVNFQGPPLDTLADMIVDLLGGASAALYVKPRDRLFQ